ncbi:Uncharacterised protein [Chryseobacterium indologenes]|nr:Uncharacterised protein [Chryseobacterium indologenes]
MFYNANEKDNIMQEQNIDFLHHNESAWNQ